MQAYDPSQDVDGPPYAGELEALTQATMANLPGITSITWVDDEPEIRVDESGLEAENLTDEDENGVEPETY